MSREQEIFLEAAHFLGARLCRDAIWAGRRCNWVGAGVLEQEGRPPTPARRACGADLYAGTSGIAAFLGRLYVSTGEKIFLLTAEGALRQALSRLDDFERSSRAGFYTGLTGVAYALFELAEISGTEKFAAMALLILEEIGKDDTEGQGWDFLTGSAGAIPALLRIHQKRREEFLLASAIRHGERLLSALPESSEVEPRRNAPVFPREGVGGLARGAAGIALALLELYCVTAEQRFLRASEQAFLSACDEATADSAAWFDGASGTGLARLRAYELTGERRHLLKAEAALRTTTAVLPEAHTPPATSADEGREDFSPAHGLTGAAELPLCASRVLGHESQRSFAERLGLRGIELYRKDDLPWPCGAPGGNETPGLMTGLAGIGYFYLRLHDATQNPSLLLVSPDGGAH